MIVKLMTEHHWECLSLEGNCRGSSETTHVKMPHCWKSHALAHVVQVGRSWLFTVMWFLCLPRDWAAQVQFPATAGGIYLYPLTAIRI